jgi:hypothetical protein
MKMILLKSQKRHGVVQHYQLKLLPRSNWHVADTSHSHPEDGDSTADLFAEVTVIILLYFKPFFNGRLPQCHYSQTPSM